MHEVKVFTVGDREPDDRGVARAELQGISRSVLPENQQLANGDQPREQQCCGCCVCLDSEFLHAASYRLQPHQKPLALRPPFYRNAN
jgi:hypothetical protein